MSSSVNPPLRYTVRMHKTEQNINLNIYIAKCACLHKDNMFGLGKEYCDIPGIPGKSQRSKSVAKNSESL